MLDVIIKKGQCYINGELKDVDVAIKDGKIHQIGQISDEAKEIEMLRDKLFYRDV